MGNERGAEECWSLKTTPAKRRRDVSAPLLPSPADLRDFPTTRDNLSPNNERDRVALLMHALFFRPRGVT